MDTCVGIVEEPKPKKVEDKKRTSIPSSQPKINDILKQEKDKKQNIPPS